MGHSRVARMGLTRPCPQFNPKTLIFLKLLLIPFIFFLASFHSHISSALPSSLFLHWFKLQHSLIILIPILVAVQTKATRTNFLSPFETVALPCAALFFHPFIDLPSPTSAYRVHFDDSNYSSTKSRLFTFLLPPSRLHL